MAALLLVDPDVGQQGAWLAGLGKAGYAVLVAGSAALGVERLREGGIELVLVHYVAGVKLEVLVAGLDRLPDPPPFVIISSALDAPTMSARHGAAEFVAEPCSVEELLTVVRRVLTQRSGPHEFEEVPTRPNERRPNEEP